MTSFLNLPPGTGDASDWTGFLDREARVEGMLLLPGTFRLDGAVKGRIVSGHLLVLGESAQVEGEIEGERVVIYGCFRGTLRATVQVEIHSGARVDADLYTPCLVLEPGAHFEGQCHLSKRGQIAEPLLVPIRPSRPADTPGS